MRKIGIYHYSFIGGNAIHLHHERGFDSVINGYYEKNKSEYEKVTKLSRKKLMEYMNNRLNIDPENKFDVDELIKIQINNSIRFYFISFLLNRIYIKLLRRIFPV
ncbi:MAG: hypothetical protein HC906_08560 [Bacteroidales bacterium]|nr:hypothetical protein [Bacteroidales bacterium]